MVIPKVKTTSVEEYFNLPISEREWHGLYMLPHALPWDIFGKNKNGWDSFFERIKKEYPIQYFFREWIFDTNNPVVFLCKKYFFWPLKEAKYAIKLYLNPVFPRWRSCLPKYKYSDISELIVTSNFALIRDFYWEEVVDGWVDWDADQQHKTFRDQLVNYVDYIENYLPEFEKKYSFALEQCSLTEEEDYHTKYASVIALEKQQRDKEIEILTWFINNKEFFWT